ncbi:hypothetical protein [Methylocystis parvus]|uniref:hypothetical protein n=1 Tax=Methylocystis parvus TaxID=134 RepID=UPI003C787FBC
MYNDFDRDLSPVALAYSEIILARGALSRALRLGVRDDIKKAIYALRAARIAYAFELSRDPLYWGA